MNANEWIVKVFRKLSNEFPDIYLYIYICIYARLATNRSRLNMTYVHDILPVNLFVIKSFQLSSCLSIRQPVTHSLTFFFLSPYIIQKIGQRTLKNLMQFFKVRRVFILSLKIYRIRFWRIFYFKTFKCNIVFPY